MPYKAFKTADGDILVGGGNERLFGVLCDSLGKPEWKTDGRFITNSLRVQNRVELEAMIEDETKTKTTKEWLDALEGTGMPYAAVNDIQGTMSHDHGKSPFQRLKRVTAYGTATVLARDMVKEIEHPTCGPMKLVNTPVKYSHSTPGIRTPPPLLGQHTDEVLRDVVGMSVAEIRDLKSEGVVA